jgi:hypothetical protein
VPVTGSFSDIDRLFCSPYRFRAPQRGLPTKVSIINLTKGWKNYAPKHAMEAPPPPAAEVTAGAKIALRMSTRSSPARSETRTAGEESRARFLFPL